MQYRTLIGLVVCLLLLFNKRSTASEFRKKIGELDDAPAVGYQPRLTIRPTNREHVFFYCKIGDDYGIRPVARH